MAILSAGVYIRLLLPALKLINISSHMRTIVIRLKFVLYLCCLADCQSISEPRISRLQGHKLDTIFCCIIAKPLNLLGLNDIVYGGERGIRTLVLSAVINNL